MHLMRAAGGREQEDIHGGRTCIDLLMRCGVRAKPAVGNSSVAAPERSRVEVCICASGSAWIVLHQCCGAELLGGHCPPPVLCRRNNSEVRRRPREPPWQTLPAPAGFQEKVFPLRVIRTITSA